MLTEGTVIWGLSSSSFILAVTNAIPCSAGVADIDMDEYEIVKKSLLL